VAQAPAWVEVWPQLSSILRGKKVGVYNDEFDVRMIQQTNQLARLAQPVPAASFFCIMRLYADFSGVRRFQALDVVGRQLGIPLPNAHRALADALLAREVFLRMAQSGRL
jgi:DNA polymerase-3 subunit epsilon